MSAETLSGLLFERCAATPNAIAVRQRRLGIWTPITWTGLRDDAARIGNGLAAKGVKPGDVVAIIGDDCLELLAAEHAVVGLGAVALVLPPDYSPETTAALVREQGANVVIVGDQEQYDKFFDGKTPSPAVVVVVATRGLRELEMAGRVDRATRSTMRQLIDDAGPEASWLALAAARSAGEVAVRLGSIVGNDVVLTESTHAELIAAATSAATSLRLQPDSTILAQRSLSEADEQVLSVGAAVLTGATVVFGEGGVLGPSEVAQVQPTHLRPSGRWLAGIAADAQKRHVETTGIKKFVLGKGLSESAPRLTARHGSAFSPSRLIGLAMSVVSFVFLLVSTGLNDWLRLLVLAVLGIVSILLLAWVPGAVAVPIRRRYGLGRAQSLVASNSVPDAGIAFLGQLGVPLVALEPVAGRIVSRVQSSLLAARAGAQS